MRLYVYVSHTGTKSLRWKYRYHRRERVLTLGMHPYVQIEQARTRAELDQKWETKGKKNFAIVFHQTVWAGD